MEIWERMGFPCGKDSACNVRDLGSISGLGRSPGEGKGYPLQYSGLENSMDYTVHEVAKIQTWLSNFHFHEKGHRKMNHSSRRKTRKYEEFKVRGRKTFEEEEMIKINAGICPVSWWWRTGFYLASRYHIWIIQEQFEQDTGGKKLTTRCLSLFCTILQESIH